MSARCHRWANQQRLGAPLTGDDDIDFKSGDYRAKGLLVAIADQAADHGITWVGNEFLLHATELPRATFFEKLKLLEDRGLLLRLKRRHRGGTQASNFLVLTLDLDTAHREFERMVAADMIRSNPMPDRVRLPDSVWVRDPDSASPPPGLTGSGTRTDEVRPPDSQGPAPGLAPPRVTEPLEDPIEDPREDSLTAERDPVAEAICGPLLEHVRRIDPSARPADWWPQAARQIVYDDGRTIDDAVALLDWALADTFWSTRVLNPRDLRKHSTAIAAARQRQAPKLDPTQRRRRLEALEATAGTCCVAPGSAPASAEAEWAALAPELREVFGDLHFDMWLSPGHAHTGEDDELLLALPEVLIGRVRDVMAPAIDRVAGRHIEIVCCQEATP